MRRRLAKLGLFLAIGVVASTVIAWALVLTPRPRTSGIEPDRWPPGTPAQWPNPEAAFQLSAPGVRLVEQSGLVRTSASWSFPGTAFGPEVEGGSFEPALVAELIRRMQYTDLRCSTLDCGWPFLAFRAREWRDDRVAEGQPVPVKQTPKSWWRSGAPVGLKSMPANVQGEWRLPIQPLEARPIGEPWRQAQGPEPPRPRPRHPGARARR